MILSFNDGALLMVGHIFSAPRTRSGIADRQWPTDTSNVELVLFLSDLMFIIEMVKQKVCY